MQTDFGSTIQGQDLGSASGELKTNYCAPLSEDALVAREWDGFLTPSFETLFAVSNGYLGCRGGYNEVKSPTDNVFLSGVFEVCDIDYHERFPGFARKTDTRIPVADPRRFNVSISHDGENIALNSQHHIKTKREIIRQSGEFKRETFWKIADTEISIQSSTIACLKQPNLIAIKFGMHSDTKAKIAIESIIDDTVHVAQKSDDPRLGIGAPSLETIESGTDEFGIFLIQKSARSGLKIAIYSCVSLSRRFNFPIAQKIDAILDFESPIEIEKFVGIFSGTDKDDNSALLAKARETALLGLKAGYEKIRADQIEVLDEKLAPYLINIDGGADGNKLKDALNFNIFSVFQAAGLNPINSVAAKGLSGEGYEGHVFWDTEVFIFPTLLLINPDAARKILEYRTRHLDAARNHAREMNLGIGALFPWRTIGGDECSAYFLAGSAQYHINADIAYAFKLYWQAHNDLDFLIENTETIFETARIWPQIGFFNPRKNGAFCIHAVTGPDEYTVLVNDNYYTNRMAKMHLDFACEIAAILEKSAPQKLKEIKAKISLLDDEIAIWKKAAQKIYLKYDDALGIYAQDENFLDRAIFDFESARGKAPLLLHYHPLNLYRYQVCKQADVVLADVLCNESSKEIARRNFDYYEAITSHDSTLSYSTYALQAARLGMLEKASEYFAENAFIDLYNLHGNTDHGGHMAAMSGAWQAIVMGFGGLQIIDNKLNFAPRIPNEWREYSFALNFGAHFIKVTISQNYARFSIDNGKISIRVFGHEITINAKESVEIPIGKNAKINAAIFDLDGVITDTAKAHYRAWSKIAQELEIDFTEQDNEKLKGVSREDSLNLLLEIGGLELPAELKSELCARKNQYYLQELENFGAKDILPGAKDALLFCRQNNIKTALASASKNAGIIIEKLGISSEFDFIADASLSRSKPAPDIFLAACDGLGIDPANAIGIEDSAAGVAAINTACMRSIGVGNTKALSNADVVLKDLTEFKVAMHDWGIPRRG